LINGSSDELSSSRLDFFLSGFISRLYNRFVARVKIYNGVEAMRARKKYAGTKKDGKVPAPSHAGVFAFISYAFFSRKDLVCQQNN